jgi:hypothetical protein
LDFTNSLCTPGPVVNVSAATVPLYFMASACHNSSVSFAVYMSDPLCASTSFVRSIVAPSSKCVNSEVSPGIFVSYSCSNIIDPSPQPATMPPGTTMIRPPDAVGSASTATATSTAVIAGVSGAAAFVFILAVGVYYFRTRIKVACAALFRSSDTSAVDANLVASTKTNVDKGIIPMV